MTVYLVDMENIPHAWGRLLDTCGEEDRFVLFYTERVTQVPITLMVKALEARVSMEYIKCHSGPNGLDFQLVTEMGSRVARDPSADYVIVSQDHGYDVVIDYWSERGIQTRRVVPLPAGQSSVFQEHGNENQGPAFTNTQGLKEFLSWKLSNRVSRGEIAFITEVLILALAQGKGYSTDRRLSCRFTFLDRALRERYGNVKGSKIRDQIKAVSREVFGMDLKILDQTDEEDSLEEAEQEHSIEGLEPVEGEQKSETEESEPMKPEPESVEEESEPVELESEFVEEESEPAELEPESVEEEPEPVELEPERAEEEPEPIKEELEPASAEPEFAEPEPTEGEPDEQPEVPVYAQLLTLDLPDGKAEALSNLVSEVLESNEVHPRAAIYRKILSAFGRVNGGELYRAVKEAVGQILSEAEASNQ